MCLRNAVISLPRHKRGKRNRAVDFSSKTLWDTSPFTLSVLVSTNKALLKLLQQGTHEANTIDGSNKCPC